jgi:hypothetical protein
MNEHIVTDSNILFDLVTHEGKVITGTLVPLIFITLLNTSGTCTTQLMRKRTATHNTAGRLETTIENVIRSSSGHSVVQMNAHTGCTTDTSATIKKGKL